MSTTILPPDELKKVLSHPLSDLFPRMASKDFDELKDDIRRNGIYVPVVLVNGKILDGRHRAQAARDLKIDCPVMDATGDPWQVAAALNLRRRHLKPEQVVAIFKRLSREAPALAKKIEETKQAAKDRQRDTLRRGREQSRVRTGAHTEEKKAPHTKPQRTSAVIAQTLGVSSRTVEQVDEVERKAPEALPAIERGDTSAKAVLRSQKEKTRRPVEPEAFHPLIAAKKLRERLAVEAGKWPPEGQRAFVGLLRDVADEMEEAL